MAGEIMKIGCSKWVLEDSTNLEQLLIIQPKLFKFN